MPHLNGHIYIICNYLASYNVEMNDTNIIIVMDKSI